MCPVSWLLTIRFKPSYDILVPFVLVSPVVWFVIYISVIVAVSSLICILDYGVSVPIPKLEEELSQCKSVGVYIGSVPFPTSNLLVGIVANPVPPY